MRAVTDRAYSTNSSMIQTGR